VHLYALLDDKRRKNSPQKGQTAWITESILAALLSVMRYVGKVPREAGGGQGPVVVLTMVL